MEKDAMIIFEFWFLVFACFFVAAGIVASEIENFAVGTATFIIGLVSLQWLFSVPIWEYIVDNPVNLILYLALYTIAGATYTLLWRWPEFIREHAGRIQSDYDAFLAKHPTLYDPKSEFYSSSYNKYNARNHTNRFATWILTWPFSLFWELARKPVKYLYKAVYALLGDAFDRMGRSVTNRILKK
jgi:hypothetical protein